MSRVLFADDTRQRALPLATYLADLGHTTDVAQSLQAACRDRHADVVVAWLPAEAPLHVADGQALAVADAPLQVADARALTGAAIIAVTQATLLTRIEFYDAGADDVLPDPCPAAQLAAAIATLLHHRALASPEAPLREPLRPIEQRILNALTAYQGAPATIAQLMADVWGPGRYEQALLRVLVRFTRGKLADPNSLTIARDRYRLNLIVDTAPQR